METRRIFRKRILLSLALSSSLIAAFNFLRSDEIEKKRTRVGAPDYDVRILRDTWGVPHIFGVTDPDVSYGMAYAHAEDDFESIQKAIMGARGKLAALFGKKYAPNDYMVQLLRVWDIVNAKYHTELSPDTRALCEAYAHGINHYANLHPDEVLPGLLPVTGKDVVGGFVYKLPFFFRLHEQLEELFEPERKREVSAGPSDRPVAKYDLKKEGWREIYGSNGLAVSPARSANGETFLAINSHQPWEGPVTWYEVHLHSEQGWDMVGGIFPGGPVPAVGHNRYLGWVHTVNRPDLIDVYVLETNPENPNQYRFDGRWLDLEVRTAPIKVKLLSALSWTFKREVLWSVYGPVVRRPHGTYALRYSGMGEVRQVEQWYRMNKAKNFEEWQSAMKMMTVPKFNCVYADYQGNIFYLYNGLLPVRREGYDWSKYLPGNTSATLWQKYLPYSKLPKVLNPSSGFLVSCNHKPYRVTIGPGNPREADYSPTLGIIEKRTNRSLRALELFSSDPSITEEEFYQYKFDMAYSTDSALARYIRETLKVPVPADPVAQEAVEILRSWDLETDPENTGTALAILTYQPFVKNKILNPAPALMMEALVETAKELKQKHGRIDVPWHKVNRLIRGDKDLGLGGGPDVLHAVYGEKMADGRLRGFVGDCFTIMVTWDKNGQVHSRSIHQYGTATLDKTSPHYADQAELFVQRKMKPVWMDEKEIRAHLEREYRPGEEVN
ncbi:MAG: acylase [bacterium]